MSFSSYKKQPYWRQYQSFFPAHARINEANAPQEEWFAWRSAAIHVDRYASAGSALTVIVLHGGGGYGRLFAPLARLLHQSGHEVIAPDLPGYGLSAVDETLVTHDAWVDLVCDLALAEHHKSDRRVVLFGGSMGGYLAYLCAARLGRDIVAGVIATTLADPRSPLVQRQFARNALVQNVLMPMMPLIPIFAPFIDRLRLPIKWFTRMQSMSGNAALNRLVGNDPHGGGAYVPVRFMRSIFTAKPVLEPEQFEVCPLLLVHPANDRWTGIASSKAFFDRIKGPKQLVMLENCGHFPVEEPGITQLQEAAIQFLTRQAALSRRR